MKSSFAEFGKDSIFCPPFHSNNLRQAYIGQNVYICPGGWIDTITCYRSQQLNPYLTIGDHTYIGHRCHIICCDRIKIGQYVLIADDVYISDNLHGFENINVPIIQQPLKLPGPVIIEDEVWLGEKTSILPGTTIGKHSVVGANSVVTHDIPPYSVAVGSPARVIRQL